MRRDLATNVRLRDAGRFSAANCIGVSDAPTPEQRPRTPPVTVGLGSRLRFCHLRRAPHSCHSPAHSTARATLLGTFSARAVALPRRVFVGEFEDRFPSVLRELRGARQDKHETLYSGSRGSFPRVRACWTSRSAGSADKWWSIRGRARRRGRVGCVGARPEVGRNILCVDNVWTIRYVQGTGVKKVPVPRAQIAPANTGVRRSPDA